MKKFFLTTFIFLVALFVAFPHVVKFALNKVGTDQNRYDFHVAEVHWKFFSPGLKLRDIVVYHANSQESFINIPEMIVSASFNKEAFIDINKITMTFAKDLIKEANREKNKAKEKVNNDFYFDSVLVKVNEMNLKNMQKATLVTINDLKLDLKDVGLGKTNENTEFKLNGSFKEGGSLFLKGKARLEGKNTPFAITGMLNNIGPGVIEKLASKKFPLEIEETKFDAFITAATVNGEVVGEIEPNIKDFKLSEDKKQGFLKRTVAKVGNFLFEKAEDKKGQVNFVIPFTLNSNLTLDLDKTIQQLQDSN